MRKNYIFKDHRTLIFFLLITAVIAGFTTFVFDYSLYGTVSSVFGFSFVVMLLFYWALFCLFSFSWLVFLVFILCLFFALKFLHTVIISNLKDFTAYDSMFSIAGDVWHKNMMLDWAYIFLSALPFLLLALIIGLWYRWFYLKFLRKRDAADFNNFVREPPP